MGLKQMNYLSKSLQWRLLDEVLEKTVEGKSVFQLLEEAEGLLYELFKTKESEKILEEMNEVGIDNLMDRAILIYGDNPEIYPSVLHENDSPYLEEKEKEKQREFVKRNRLELFALLFIHDGNLVVKEIMSKDEEGQFISIAYRMKPMNKKVTDKLREEIKKKVERKN